MLQCVEESFDTLPAGFAGGLDADLDQNVLGGTVLSTVVGGHSQLIHAFFAIAQFLSVFDEAWVKQGKKGEYPGRSLFNFKAAALLENIYTVKKKKKNFELISSKTKHFEILKEKNAAKYKFLSKSDSLSRWTKAIICWLISLRAT